MGHKQLQNSFESNNFTETQDTELKQEGTGGEKKEEKGCVSHCSCNLHFRNPAGTPALEVTDALAVCPAAKPDAASEVPQQPAVPATTIYTSSHIVAYNHQGSSQPRDAAAASWHTAVRSVLQHPAKSQPQGSASDTSSRLFGDGICRKEGRKV